MRFMALACDYDGTLATRDRMPAEGVAALERARDDGIRLILVTGRTFFELTRVCERLDLFDAVVAENGGVIYHPRAGAIWEQAPPPSPRLIAELDRRGVAYQLGHVIVDVARSDEAAVREAMRAADVSLEAIYNRAALMLLPAGLSKGTGVSQALRSFGLSSHDVLALGDAENDLALFAACGWAGCPEHAVPELREAADWVFPGPEALGIARAIEGPVLGGDLPVAESPRHRIAIGWATGSAETVTMPERGVNVLIHGDPFSGKSWLAGALVERLVARRYAVCVIDPEGDYAVLARLPGVAREELGSTSASAVERALAPFEREPAASVVVDLAALPHRRKAEAIGALLASIGRRRQRVGFPHWVVLDEAHYSLHPEGVGDDVVGLENRGFCLLTYKPSWLRESVVKALDILVLARTTAPEELAFLGGLVRAPEGEDGPVAVLEGLPWGEFVAIRRDAAGRRVALTFRAGPRETPHVRHLAKYADTRVPRDRAFHFRHPEGEPAGVAESLNEFCQVAGAVPGTVLAFHAGRGDFSRWALEVFSDPTLARALRKTETRFDRGEIQDLRTAICRLVALRYGAEP